MSDAFDDALAKYGPNAASGGATAVADAKTDAAGSTGEFVSAGPTLPIGGGLLQALPKPQPKDAYTEALRKYAPTPSVGQYALEAGRQLVRSTVGSTEGTLEGAYRGLRAILPEAMKGPLAEQDAILGAMRVLEAKLSPNPVIAAKGGMGAFLSQTTPSMVGGVVPYVAGGALAESGSGLGTLTAAGQMGLGQGASAYTETLQKTGSEEKAWEAYLGNLAGGTAVGLIPASRILARVTGAPGGAALKSLLLDAGSGGMSMSAAQAVHDTLANRLNGEDLDVLGNAAKAFPRGAAFGVVMGGVSHVAGKLAGGKPAEAVPSPEGEGAATPEAAPPEVRQLPAPPEQAALPARGETGGPYPSVPIELQETQPSGIQPATTLFLNPPRFETGKEAIPLPERSGPTDETGKPLGSQSAERIDAQAKADVEAILNPKRQGPPEPAAVAFQKEAEAKYPDLSSKDAMVQLSKDDIAAFEAGKLPGAKGEGKLLSPEKEAEIAAKTGEGEPEEPGPGLSSRLRRAPESSSEAGFLDLFGKREKLPEKSAKEEPDAAKEELRNYLGNLQLVQQRIAADKVRFQGVISQEAKKLGVSEELLDRAIKQNVDLRNPSAAGHAMKYGPTLKPEDRAAVELAGKLPPEAKAVADEMVKAGQADRDLAIKTGMMTSGVEAHLARILKPTEEQPGTGLSRGKFNISTARTKQRTFGSDVEALAAGRELVVPRATDAYAIGRTQINEALANRAVVASLKAAGMADNTARPGLVRVNTPRLFDSGEINGERVSLPLYAEPALAKALENIVGESKLKGWGPREVSNAVNAAYQRSLFFGGAFHASQFAQRWMLTRPKGTPLNPLKAAAEGERAIQEMGPLLQEGIKGGLRPYQRQDIVTLENESSRQTLGLINQVPMPGAWKDGLVTLQRNLSNFTFDHFGAPMKTLGFIADTSRALEQRKAEILEKPGLRQEIVQAYASKWNNIFGGQNLQKITLEEPGSFGKLTTPTTWDVLGQAFIARDWNLSKIRLMAQAFQNGEAGKVHRAMWIQTAYRGAAIAAAYNVVMGALDDRTYEQQYRDRWAQSPLGAIFGLNVDPVLKALDAPNGSFVPVLGTFKTPASWFWNTEKDRKGNETWDPLGGLEQAAAARAALFPKLALDLIRGTDYLGRPFTTISELMGTDDKGTYMTTNLRGKTPHIKGEPIGGKLEGELSSYKSEEKAGGLHTQQIPSYAGYEVKGVLPIPLQSAAAFWHMLSGQLVATDMKDIARAGGLEVSIPKEKK